jgi:hypothetical protein
MRGGLRGLLLLVGEVNFSVVIRTAADSAAFLLTRGPLKSPNSEPKDQSEVEMNG